MRLTRCFALTLICIGALFTSTMLAASAHSDQTQTEKSAKISKTEQTAVMQEQVFTVEGSLMAQIPITARNSFTGVTLPTAPAKETDHVPLNR